MTAFLETADALASPEAILAAAGAGGVVEHFTPTAPARDTSRRLRLWTLAECAAAPSRGYLVKGVIAPGDLAILFGPPGAGKSVLAPYLAHAVASGRMVFGRRVRGGPVLYIAAEDGEGMKGRGRALRDAFGDASGFAMVAAPINLQGDGATDPPDLAVIREAADRIGAVLVVIDTLAAAFPGLNENDPPGMGWVVRVLRALGGERRAVLVVHHGAKGGPGGNGGDTPRGHGILDAAADVTLRIVVPDDPGNPREVRFGKNRNGTSLARFAFAIRVETMGEDDDGDPITAPVAEEVAPDPAGMGRDRAAAERRLGDAATLLLRELRNLAADATTVAPVPGMPAVPAVGRDALIRRLLAAGWFHDGERRNTVPETGNASHPVTREGQRRLGKSLDTLKRKGFAGCNAALAWPL